MARVNDKFRNVFNNLTGTITSVNAGTGDIVFMYGCTDFFCEKEGDCIIKKLTINSAQFNSLLTQGIIEVDKSKPKNWQDSVLGKVSKLNTEQGMYTVCIGKELDSTNIKQELYTERDKTVMAQEHHNNRTMFVVLGDIRDEHYILAVCDDSCSHEEWFKKEFPSWGNMMEGCLRGFIDSVGVYMYRGYDFHYNVEDCNIAMELAKEIMEHTKVDGLRNVCLGMIVDNTKIKYEPQLKLCALTRDGGRED